jgi:hypothetical protein
VLSNLQVDRMPIPPWLRPITIPRGCLERDISAHVPDVHTELVGQRPTRYLLRGWAMHAANPLIPSESNET